MLSLRYGQLCNKISPRMGMTMALEVVKWPSHNSVMLQSAHQLKISHSHHTLSQAPLRLCLPNTPLSNTIRTQIRKAQETDRSEIVTAKDKPFGELSTSEKVKRAGTDATYTVVVIAGIAVTGALFFAIGRELLSGQSPSGVYGKALKLVRNHDDIAVALGEPIKGYGETSRRGRRRHVNHFEFEKDGVKHMRMKFYVEGPAKKGTVHLEAQQDASGKYEFRYLFVTLEEYPSRTIIIQDNRASLAAAAVDSVD